MTRLKLTAILAHPDDESLGVGGVLARYAAEGIEARVVTATRGQAGRHGHDGPHPGPDTLGHIREQELRRAAAELGVRDVRVLDYMDGALDEADPSSVIGDLVHELRRTRPQVVVTFAPDGAYGHPDHVAICQLATAAVVAAADSKRSDGLEPHAVDKLYYMAWSGPTWDAYQAAFKRLTSTVDGVVRQAVPWPDWAITTVVDTSPWWRTVWRAIQCHETQLPGYEPLVRLSEAEHSRLWGRQSFYRVFSTVNGSRSRESDLFEGLRPSQDRGPLPDATPTEV